MDIIISNSNKNPIYDQIASQIKNFIITGVLKEGDALPSMRLLAKELRISVITTKRAYEELERDGFIETVTGRGSFVASKTGTKKQTAKSIAETAKYTVKDEDYLIPEDKELSKETVYILDRALANRRLVAFGGKLRKIHRELNLDDIENGDLVNTDNEDEELREDVKYHIEVYDWNVGYNQYFRRN